MERSTLKNRKKRRDVSASMVQRKEEGYYEVKIVLRKEKLLGKISRNRSEKYKNLHVKTQQNLDMGICPYFE